MRLHKFPVPFSREMSEIRQRNSCVSGAGEVCIRQHLRHFPVFSRGTGKPERRRVRARLTPPPPSPGGTGSPGFAGRLHRQFAGLARAERAFRCAETRGKRDRARFRASVSVRRRESPHHRLPRCNMHPKSKREIREGVVVQPKIVGDPRGG